MRLLREANDSGKQINFADQCSTIKWYKWFLAELRRTTVFLGSVQSNAHNGLVLLRL